MEEFTVYVEAARKVEDILQEEGFINQNQGLENLHITLSNGKAINPKKSFQQNQLRNEDVIYVHLKLRGGS